MSSSPCKSPVIARNENLSAFRKEQEYACVTKQSPVSIIFVSQYFSSIYQQVIAIVYDVGQCVDTAHFYLQPPPTAR